jgi:hypothetical protein
MACFMIFSGWLVIFLSGYVLSKILKMIFQYHQNLQSHGVKKMPLLRAHFVVGGAWTAAFLVGVSMVAWGWDH